MKIPLSWIKKYIQLDLPVDEIAKTLTMAGIEVDGYQAGALSFSGIIVGRVLSAEKHPNADKLTLAIVTDGKQEYQVVCGAPNCRSGIKVAFAPIGAVLKEEDGKEFVIKKTKIRGVESYGMLCSGKELHISEEADGIMELDESLQEGTSLADLYADVIFDVSLTPNLSHCMSIIGVARELSAALNKPIHFPKIVTEETGKSMEEQMRVSVLDSHACPRYACRLITNVKVGPSPDWLRSALEKSGLRSINNVVDVTNYVLLEMGHPLHAFDYDLLGDKRIIVKKAEEGECFTTLDGKTRILSKEDLMICDGAHSIAIAGVMGGENSEVSDRTCNVLLESAYFDPVTVRKTSKRLGLQTDSSKRFERGTDPNGLIASLDRAALFIQDVAGGQVCSGTIDVHEKAFPEAVIRCRLHRINKILGLQLSQGEVESIFKRLHFQCIWQDQDTAEVRVPTYRVDIQTEIDLIEEVARVYGYNNIPRKGGEYRSSVLPHSPIYLFEKKIESHMISEGLQEFLTCDLIGPSLLAITQDVSLPSESLISVLNPTSIEQSIMRASLLPGLLQVTKYNIDHQNHRIAGFEIGRVHFKDVLQYKEPSVLGIVLSGPCELSNWNEKPRHYDFFDMKGIIERVLTVLGIKGFEFKNLKLNTFHTGRQASVFVNSLELGSFGEIHPAILRRLDVSQRVLFAEFNLNDLMQVIGQREKVKALAIYPSSERDWTVTIKKDVPFTRLLNDIQKEATDLLEEVSLRDIYCSDKLGHGFHNMTLHFVYRDRNKTIDQERVDAEHNCLVTNVIKELADVIKVSDS